MTNPPINQSISKSKALLVLEYVLLAVCLCVVALRATFTEGPAVQFSTLPNNISDNLYSLSISALLIFSFILWFAWSFCSRRFVYRFTGIEIGLVVFFVAAIIAGFAAADKRLAITNVVTLAAPVLMAVLLVQILDSHAKVKLLLCVIGALGVVITYQCAEQFFVSNQMTIEQYEQDPESVLVPLGIESGTFKHFLFEHRLYTRGVSGFFTTRNSAGTFLLMASFTAVILFIEKFKNRRSEYFRSIYLFACGFVAAFLLFGLTILLMASFTVVVLFIDKFKNRKSEYFRSIYLFACGFVAAFLLFGLAITRSKGAIIGWLFAAVAFILYLGLGNRLKNFGRIIFIACILIAVTGCLVIAWYGLSHGRLPGGNSMLVRWQYWQASAKMYAEQPFTGVGPGNFGHFYPYYKPAAAPESVTDPHNFPLSLLTQYGPLGLIAFLAVIFVPLCKVLSQKSSADSQKSRQTGPPFKTIAVTFLVIISALIFLTRPAWMPTALDDLVLVLYMTLRFYIPPVAVFIAGFLILADPLQNAAKAKSEIRNAKTAALLFCALLGVLLHNLTDFAIFEPGVFTIFCAMLACLIAIDNHRKSRPFLVFAFHPVIKIFIICVSVVLIWAYFNFAFIPTARSTTGILRADNAVRLGKFDDAHRLLDRAAQDDPLSSDSLTQNGRLYLHQFKLTQRKNRRLLIAAENCFKAAIERNDAVYKNFEQLAETYCLLANVSVPQKKADWLSKAYDTATLAIERYPDCGRLHFDLARIAEQLGKSDIAVEEYKRSIEIEDEYRVQFRQMYPERKDIVSRIGEDKYQFAKEKVTLLSIQPPP
jgi:O-antigen ligase/tetratricopeptide (TPR) repeat protein